MTVRTLFVTRLYETELSFDLAALAEASRAIASEDIAGQRWARDNAYGGYTSYASLNQLHKFSSTFTGLERKLNAHVKRFAAQLDLDLRGRTIRLTDLWVNIMPEHAAHSLHLHPLSFISGTY